MTGPFHGHTTYAEFIDAMHREMDALDAADDAAITAEEWAEMEAAGEWLDHVDPYDHDDGD